MTAETHAPAKAGPAPSLRRPLILSAIFALLTTLLLADLAPRFAPGLLRFEHYMGDVRTAFLSDQLPSQHPQVAIVTITPIAPRARTEFTTRMDLIIAPPTPHREIKFGVPKLPRRHGSPRATIGAFVRHLR